MGHFTINLPDNKHADVRQGSVRKLVLNLNIFSKSKRDSQPKIGYKVVIAPNEVHELYRSTENDWTKDPDGKIPINDEPLLSIKNAIIEKESSGI